MVVFDLSDIRLTPTNRYNRTHDPSVLQTQKEFYGIGNRGGQTRERQRRLSDWCSHYSCDRQERSSHRQRRQSGENLRIQHQTCRTGNSQVCIQRLWPLLARLRPLLHTRALCDVRRRLRLVQNRSSRLWRFPGRHCRIWPKARHGGLQMEGVSYLVRVCFQEG